MSGRSALVAIRFLSELERGSVIRRIACAWFWLAAGCAVSDVAVPDGPYTVVLGIAQDAGIPQAGAFHHPGWRDGTKRRLVTSLGLVDPRSGRRWMLDATPDFREQLYRLHELSRRSLPLTRGVRRDAAVGPGDDSPGSDRSAPATVRSSPDPDDDGVPARHAPVLDGIFLTHGHIGHYTGLMFLGHESMGARGVPVYAMPRMRRFLEANGPWALLVAKGNITLRELAPNAAVPLADDLRVEPLVVPHRDEYSETVAYRIVGPSRSVLFLPDIDSWEQWDAAGTRIEDVLATVDVAYIDGTFFHNGEIPGRDMTGFPHPFITNTIDRLRSLPADQRAKVRFIHLNHTNPAQHPDGDAARAIRRAGMRVAEPMECVGL
jgi:pyrroloquinoline quinone biosynthesis protein B